MSSPTSLPISVWAKYEARNRQRRVIARLQAIGLAIFLVIAGFAVASAIHDPAPYGPEEASR